MQNNIYDLLHKLDDVKENAKINFYYVKYLKRTKCQNYAYAFPDGANERIVSGICADLEIYKDFQCKVFNATEVPIDTYEYVTLEIIQDKWIEIKGLIDNPKPFKGENAHYEIAMANLGICHMTYSGQEYYLFLKQQSFENLLKGKSVFMQSNDVIKDIEASELFLLSLSVDFIIYASTKNQAGHVYVLNRKYFERLFDFYDHIKKSVQKEINLIDQWNFLDSTELIKKKVEQKNVYANLFKVFQDKEYVEQIRKVNLVELKTRLINKSNGAFTENDFKENKLVVTRSNLSNIMKALAKGFKYNFITDKAEDE